MEDCGALFSLEDLIYRVSTVTSALLMPSSDWPILEQTSVPKTMVFRCSRNRITGLTVVPASRAANISRSRHLVRADVVCAYLKPGSFDVFELESALGVPLSPRCKP